MFWVCSDVVDEAGVGLQVRKEEEERAANK